MCMNDWNRLSDCTLPVNKWEDPKEDISKLVLQCHMKWSAFHTFTSHLSLNRTINTRSSKIKVCSCLLMKVNMLFLSCLLTLCPICRCILLRGRGADERIATTVPGFLPEDHNQVRLPQGKLLRNPQLRTADYLGPCIQPRIRLDGEKITRIDPVITKR